MRAAVVCCRQAAECNRCSRFGDNDLHTGCRCTTLEGSIATILGGDAVGPGCAEAGGQGGDAGGMQCASAKACCSVQEGDGSCWCSATACDRRRKGDIRS